MTDTNRRTEILNNRFYFLIELFIVFVGITIFNFIFNAMRSLFQTSTLIDTYFYYLFKLVAALIAVPIFLFVVNIIFQPKQQNLIVESDMSSSKQQLLLLKIKKSNFKYQLLWGLLILFIVYIPFSLFSYLLPGYLEFESDVIFNNTFGSYLGEEVFIFLISAIIIQFLSSFKEEWIYRGFFINRGEQYLGKFSPIIITSIFFGLSHFAYIFSPNFPGHNPLYPIFWGIIATIVGFISASFFTRKKWLFPLIFAHTISNIIAAFTLWYFIQGGSFFDLLFLLYTPLIVIGIILVIFQFSRVKKGINYIFEDIKNYFNKNQKLDETKTDRNVRIIFDIIIIFIIWLMSFLFII